MAHRRIIRSIEELLHPHAAEVPRAPSPQIPIANSPSYQTQVEEDYSLHIYPYTVISSGLTGTHESQLICAMSAIQVSSQFLGWIYMNLPSVIQDSWTTTWYTAFRGAQEMLDSWSVGDSSHIYQLREPLHDFFPGGEVMHFDYDATTNSTRGIILYFPIPPENTELEEVHIPLSHEQLEAMSCFQQLTSSLIIMLQLLGGQGTSWPISIVNHAMRAYIIARSNSFEIASRLSFNFQDEPQSLNYPDIAMSRNLAADFYHEWQARCRSTLAFSGATEFVPEYPRFQL